MASDPYEADWGLMFETLQRIALYDAGDKPEAALAEWSRHTLSKLTARLTRWTEVDD